MNRALYKLLTGEESLPASLLTSIEVTPKAKVVHRKRRTSQELLLNISIPLPPDSKFFQKHDKGCSEGSGVTRETVDIKAAPTRPDTLTKSHADYLYSDISSSDDWEFASPLFVSVDKKIMSGAVAEQPTGDPVKYSDVSSSDNSPATLSKLRNVTVAPEQSVVNVAKDTGEAQQSTEPPVITTPMGDVDNDTVFVDQTTTDNQSTEGNINDDEQQLHEVTAVKPEENVASDITEDHASVSEVDVVAPDIKASPSSSKEETPPDTECTESEEPIPELKVRIEEEKKPLVVDDDGNSGTSGVDKDDRVKDKTVTPAEAVTKGPVKVTDKTIKLVTSGGSKVVSDKVITLPTTTKSQLLVKSITKPYQAPELQKLTTPFTIATSSFKTGSIDNKLPKSGIITKSLFLPSPTKGNSNNVNNPTKPQNPRSSPVRSSSLVRTTSIVVPKPAPTMASSNSNKLTLSTVTTKTLSTIKTINNGSFSKASTLSNISKPFQVNGMPKSLTATAPRTLTAPVVSKTLVVSSSTIKPNNSVTTSKQQDAGGVKTVYLQKTPVASVVTSTSVAVVTTASTSVASKTATPSTVPKPEAVQQQQQKQQHSKHNDMTNTSKGMT